MNLEEYLKVTAEKVNCEIEKNFPKKASEKWVKYSLSEPEFGFDYSALQGAITDPIWDFLLRGGKRWRPALMLLSCSAVGGDENKALPFTVIPELVHNGTIMVDDVEDSSELRRGKSATHLIFGIDVAVNAGNSMYYLPLNVLYNSSFSDSKKVMIYDAYSKEMIKLSLGQGMDIYWHNGHNNAVTEAQYLQMCSYKTASLARFAIKLGAILGDASKEQIEALESFATSIGVAFQIQDDVLNLKPKDGWGKEIGDDIHEGKRTLIVVNAFSKLNEKDSKKLVKILDSKKTTKKEIKEAISMLADCGSIDYAKEYAKKLVSEGWLKVDKVIPKSDSKVLLKEFADYLIERDI